uniref:Putative ovule protein n=1 Tax=Solanum chacoense TaxID=4108 RepID=A0A0V0H4Q9_SOLCH
MYNWWSWLAMLTFTFLIFHLHTGMTKLWCPLILNRLSDQSSIRLFNIELLWKLLSYISLSKLEQMRPFQYLRSFYQHLQAC